MKVTKVQCNNRKKSFLIECRSGALEFPYSELSVRPNAHNPIEEVWIDPDVGKEGFTYRLRSGDEDTVLLDQVLHFNEDPEYLRQQLLYKLSLQAQRALKRRNIAKRELARRMNTTSAQVHRLLDQTFYGKTLDQMVRLLAALGCTVDVVLKDAA